MNGKNNQSAAQHLDVTGNRRGVIRAGRCRLALGAITLAIAAVAINAPSFAGDTFAGDTTEPTTQPMQSSTDGDFVNQPLTLSTTMPSFAADPTTVPSDNAMQIVPPSQGTAANALPTFTGSQSALPTDTLPPAAVPAGAMLAPDTTQPTTDPSANESSAPVPSAPAPSGPMTVVVTPLSPTTAPTTQAAAMPAPTTDASAAPDATTSTGGVAETGISPSTEPTQTLPPMPPQGMPAAAAPAAGEARPSIIKGSTSLVMQVNKSRVIETNVPIHVVSVAQPEIANFQVIGANTLLLNALRPGATQMILWDDQNHSQIVDIDVEMDLVDLRSQLKTMFPDAAITVTAVNGSIALSGRVPSLEVADRAVQIATPYANKVLNFMEISGGTQVMLHVRFAEIGRSVSDAFGFSADATDGSFTFGDINGPGGSPIGALATGGDAASTISSDVALFGSGGIGATRFEAFLQALRENSLLKTLAEPDLITQSGQEADFLAGGEFPVPVPQTSGGGTSITVDYKEYGVKLRFIPVVLGDGRIRMKVSPSVSALDDSTAVTFDNYVTPGLTERSVVTTVELAEGQTFAIAGLLQDNVNATSNITPLLGDLPIVGPLFRSVSYQRKETELLILVTPHLVSPMNPGQVPELPGEHWRYPTEAEIFWNHDLGGEGPATNNRPTIKAGMNAPKFHGDYGFVPVGSAGSTDATAGAQ